MALFSQCNTSNNSVFSVEEVTPYAICYAKVTPEQVQHYRMVIVEPDFYSQSEMESLRNTGTKILAYVTLGEVDQNRWYYPELKELGFRGKNENWNSHFINLQLEEARRILLKEVIPRIAAKGVDGFFLDTIDAVSPETERGDLQPYMVELIEGIRAQYPHKIIIQNAGLFLLDQTEDDINAFLTEALASDYDFAAREYKVRSDKEFNLRLGYLNEYIKGNGLPFFILDFAETEDQLSQIKTRLDTLKRPYYISNIGLSEIPVQPDSVANNLKGLSQ